MENSLWKRLWTCRKAVWKFYLISTNLISVLQITYNECRRPGGGGFFLTVRVYCLRNNFHTKVKQNILNLPFKHDNNVSILVFNCGKSSVLLENLRASIQRCEVQTVHILYCGMTYYLQGVHINSVYLCTKYYPNFPDWCHHLYSICGSAKHR